MTKCFFLHIICLTLQKHKPKEKAMVKRITILLLLSFVLSLSVYSQTSMKQMSIITLKVYMIDPSGATKPLQRSPISPTTLLQAYYNFGVITFDEELTPCTLTILNADTGIIVFSSKIEKNIVNVEIPLETGHYIVKFIKDDYLYLGNLII